MALACNQQLQAYDPAAVQRCEPGPKDGREKTLPGKWEGSGDGHMNKDKDRNGHNGRYEGMNRSGNGCFFREDDGENGDPGNLRNDSRGEVEQAREWVTPTRKQQP